MRNITSLTLILITIIIISLSACENSSNSLECEKGSVLHFESMEDYYTALSTIRNMNDKELKEWENQHNFSSFGTLAKTKFAEVYESYKGDVESLERELTKSKYLSFVKNKQGEYEVDFAYSNNPNIYFANNEGLFTINNTVVKIFENTSIVTNVENIDYLKTILDGEVSQLQDDKNLLFWNHKLTSEITLKSTSCGFVNNSIEARETDGSDRVKITLGSYEVSIATGILNGYIIGEIRPYFKRFGVWFRCKRTLTGAFKVAYQVREDNGWSQVYQASWYQPSSNDWSKSAYILGPTYISETNSTNIVGYNCWGHSASLPSGKNAVLKCSPELCE